MTMASPFGPGQPYQPALYQPAPGGYGLMPAMTPVVFPVAALPVASPVDRFQPQASNSIKPPPPWYVKAGVEALKVGAVIGASLLGGLVGNVPGALLAGGLAAGTVSVADQKYSHGKVSWATAAVDTMIGLIPAGFGGAIVKGAQSLLGKKLFESAGAATLGQVMSRGAAMGALDGSAIGYVGAAAHSGLESYRQTGSVDWGNTNQSGLQGLLAGALGGAVVGGALTSLVRYCSQKGGEHSFEKAKHRAGNKSHVSDEISTPSPEALKGLTPPRRTWFNRLVASLTLRSEDKLLGNFHQVDKSVFRGAMPESVEAFAHLKKQHGVRTIIDLRGLETTKAKHIQFEKGHAKANGLTYVHLPMDSHVPPTQQQLNLFLNAIDQAKQSGGNVYVHCKHGIDRTGVMVAAYEVLNGKKQAEAYRHMVQYGFNRQHQWSRFHQRAFVLQGGLPELLKQVRPNWVGVSGS